MCCVFLMYTSTTGTFPYSHTLSLHAAHPIVVPFGRLALAPPMRPGAYTGIIGVAPVSEIVPAFLPDARMVRHFVARQSRRARHRLRRVEQLGGGIDVGDDAVALRRERGDTRAGLGRELIERQRAGSARPVHPHASFPGGISLARPRHN